MPSVVRQGSRRHSLGRRRRRRRSYVGVDPVHAEPFRDVSVGTTTFRALVDDNDVGGVRTGQRAYEAFRGRTGEPSRFDLEEAEPRLVPGYEIEPAFRRRGAHDGEALCLELVPDLPFVTPALRGRVHSQSHFHVSDLRGRFFWAVMSVRKGTSDPRSGFRSDRSAIRLVDMFHETVEQIFRGHQQLFVRTPYSRLRSPLMLYVVVARTCAGPEPDVDRVPPLDPSAVRAEAARAELRAPLERSGHPGLLTKNESRCSCP